MTTTIQIDISFDSLITAIKSLDLSQKRGILEILEDQKAIIPPIFWIKVESFLNGGRLGNVMIEYGFKKEILDALLRNMLNI